MIKKDIRGIQHYKNFKQAFAQLQKSINLYHERALTELEEQGLIQTFECTHELAWNVLKDFLEEQGVLNFMAPKMLHKKPLSEV